MITINLKPGARRQAPAGDRFARVRERLTAWSQGIKQPGLAFAIGMWVLAVLVVGGMYLSSTRKLHRLEPQLATAVAEYKTYHAFVREKRREERVRDSILQQIGTISAVDQDRYTWSHVLDEVAGAVPEMTWLTSVSPVAVSTAVADSTVTPTVSVLIAGQTNDLQNYTAFLRRLGESPWLVNVVPVKTETIVDRGNRPITSFTVQATFARADSTHVQTVPILESTVR